MQIRHFDYTKLARDNGLMARRLLPWPGLAVPFEGSWCRVSPGAASGAHAHHEYEVWIGVSGDAEIVHAGGRARFAAGDIVHFPPHTDHQIVNDGEEVFEMYALWWDADMARGFVAAASG
jgi:oxalate decarboxylase/phosphoglucose isomerase-like protein (cupin superfamily)